MAASTALITSCAVCNFGAIASSILSFSAHVVETITVSITPHVTIFPDGHRTTSFESHTLSEAIVLNTGVTGTSLAATTYTDEADITWTVGDATLTYPTSYVHYLGFAGIPAATDNGQSCAVQSTTSLMLPTSTDATNFIYPLGNTTAAVPLPHALLEYLDGLDIVSSQYHGEPLTACAPLVTSGLPTFEVYTIASVLKRFEGPRRTSAQQPMMTSAPQAINGTLYKRRYGSGSGVGTGGTGISGGSAGSTSSSTAHISSISMATSTKARSMSDITSDTSVAYDTIASVAGSVVPVTNVHTTAFVITAITGRAVTTTESAPAPALSALIIPSPSPSPSPNVGGGDDSSGGDSGSTSGYGDSGNGQSGDNGSGQSSSGSGQLVSLVAANVPTSTTPGSGPNLSNLISQVNSVVQASAVQTIGGGPDVSNLVGGIGSIAANGASIIVDGASTVEFSELPSSSTTGLGEYINSGLNAATTTSASKIGTTSSGSASASFTVEVYVSSGSRMQISLAVCACLLGWVLVV